LWRKPPLRRVEHVGAEHLLLSLDGEEGIPSSAVQRHPATLAGLVSTDTKRPGGEVHIRPPERLELAPSHPCVERHRHKRAKPLRERFQEPTLLFTAKASIPGVVLLEELDGGDGVERDATLPDRSIEHGLEQLEVVIHGRYGSRFSERGFEVLHVLGPNVGGQPAAE
jgi:hypothetical protein